MRASLRPTPEAAIRYPHQETTGIEFMLMETSNLEDTDDNDYIDTGK
jgi:hypothetical protein